MVIVVALAGVVSVYAPARYLSSDPMEYDMRRVRNERGGRSAAAELNNRVDDVVGRLGQSGMAHKCPQQSTRSSFGSMRRRSLGSLVTTFAA